MEIKISAKAFAEFILGPVDVYLERMTAAAI
jgi:hypothetical protein